MKRPLAYITAPWGENEYENTENAARWCRQVYDAGFSPVCPLLFLPLFLEDVYEKREEIREQIEYDLICTPVNRTQVDEFVELMLEVAMTRSPTIKIGRDAEYPTAFVQQRFEQITSSHIEKVLDGISENNTRVWNAKAYLLAALFNAPSSTDNHYTMLVNHDFHHDYGG